MEPTLTPHEWAEHVKSTNEQFMSGSKQQRRVMLAKDILDQLRARRIRPASNYFTLMSMERCQLNAPMTEQIKDSLARAPYCVVCGIGALFVAAVQRLNDLTHDQFYKIGDAQFAIHDYLGKYELFTKRELWTIEKHFESGFGFDTKKRNMERLCNFLIETDGKDFTDEKFNIWWCAQNRLDEEKRAQ